MAGQSLYPPPDLRIPTPEEDRNPVDPFGVGLQDLRASGWFVCPGESGQDEIVEGMPIGRDDVVLDSGCGVGRMSGWCARSGAEMVLVDVNPESLEAARRRAVEAGAKRVRCFVSDCDPIPLEDATASRVLCTEVLEHVDDPARVVGELFRVGRPGALYLFTVPAPDKERVLRHVAPAGYFEQPNHVRVFDPQTLDQVIENSGLVIERRSSYGFFWSVFFSMYWKTGARGRTTAHPALDHWTQSWRALLASEEGLEVKRALDEAMPNSLVRVARKPG